MFRFFRKRKADQGVEMAHILKHIEEEKPLFRRGGLVTTPKITSELQFEEIGFLLQLHDHGHWGSVPRPVALSNDQIVGGNRQG